MNDFRDVLGSKMSTGMKQKVSIARTIVHDPPVLIFDEPTSGLDVLVARAVLQNIIELRERGKTIIFSTHSMHEVEKLCARVAIIHKGRLQVEGAPRELLARFDQPDLEELFFFLVERSEAGSNGSVPAPASLSDGRRAPAPQHPVALDL
jgi:sodium transport system ATP-binding protein